MWFISLALVLYLSSWVEAGTGSSKVSIPITNAIQLYSIPVSIGDPARVHVLAIGTGSSNTYCGAKTAYIPSRSTVDLHSKFHKEYMYGHSSGNWVNDTLAFGTGDNRIVLTQVTIGNVTSLQGFANFDGVLGLNRVGETGKVQTIWTPMSYMWHRNLLQQNVFSISFKPTPTMTPEENGLITFGGIEPSRFTGQIYWYPCQSYNAWDWTVSISFGGNPLHSTPIMGSFDSSTTLGPSLADDLFTKYVAAIPGAIWNNDDYWKNNADGSVNRHLLKIPKTSISQMKDLCFTAADRRPWCLTPEAQLIPENQLPDATYRYSYVTPLGATTADGSTFIFGMKGLERFYSVYDIENYRIGLAETAWTRAKF